MYGPAPAARSPVAPTGSSQADPSPRSAPISRGAAVNALRSTPPTAWPDDPGAGGRPGAETRCDGRGTWLVALSGEHDLSTVPLLEQRTSHVWSQCRIAVIDLSEVTFLDSSLIAWLLRVESALEDAHGFTLSVVTGPDDGPAGKLFRRARMDCVLACYPTCREAFRQAVAGADALAWPPPAAATPATTPTGCAE